MLRKGLGEIMDPELSKWIDLFLRDVMSCMLLKSILQRLTYVCEPVDDFIGISVYPALVLHNGQVYSPKFEFSVLNMMLKFEHLSNITWSETHVSIEGKYAGRPVWFKFYPKEQALTADKIVVNLN